MKGASVNPTIEPGMVLHSWMGLSAIEADWGSPCAICFLVQITYSE